MSTNKYIDDGIYYAESDGQPMADNTLQYEWIVTIKEGLEVLLPNDFVAADLFWYPVKEDPHIHYAPDVMVAFGRPKGHRSSYKQWEEENIAPQIVFEILSPSNTATEMFKKCSFYNTYGVQEYYVFDPNSNELFIYSRNSGGLTLVHFIGGWVSPLLGIRLQLSEHDLKIFYPNGDPFRTYLQVVGLVQQERQEKEEALAKVAQERHEKEEALVKAEQAEAKAEQAEAKMEQERQEKEKLREKLKQLGIDPDSI